jgi:transposase-like protein
MKDNRSGRRYDAQFKEQAVRMVLTSGKSIGCVAKELGVSPHTLKDWKETHLKNGGSALTLDLENQRLRRELERVTQQRDILKKSLGILFQEPPPKDMPS